MKKRFWALRDKYLPALLITLFAASAADGQVYQRNLTPYGNQGRRLAIDSTINIPTGCGAPTTTQEHGMQGEMRMAKLFYDSCNAKFYIYNPSTSTWNTSSAGSAGGGISEVLAGFGLQTVNDSTLRADSSLLATKLYVLHVKDSIIALIPGSSGPAGIGEVVASYGLANVNDSTLRVDTLQIATRAWRQKGIDSVVGLLSQIPSGITQVVGTNGLSNVNDSTLQADTLVLSTRAWRQKGIDSVINVLNLRTIQDVLDAGNLITEPAQTIDNDPSNLTGSFGIRQGIGGSTLGDFLVGYRANRFINSTSDGNNLAGFYSSVDTITALGLLRKSRSAGYGNYLSGSKWVSAVMDSNEHHIRADTMRNIGVTRLEGLAVFGNPETNVSMNSGSTLIAYFARRSTSNNAVMALYGSAANTTTGGGLGTVTNQIFGLFANDQAYSVYVMPNGGTNFGRNFSAGQTGEVPVNGLRVGGRSYFYDTVRLRVTLPTVSTSDSVLVKASNGDVRAWKRISDFTGGGSGTDNANVGSGFRFLKPASQEIKTLFGGYGLTIDSTSNTDGITITADTATLFPAVRATIPAGGGSTNLANTDLTQTAEPRTFDHNNLDFYWENLGETRWYGSGGYSSERIMIADGKMGRWYGGRIGTGTYFEAADSMYMRGAPITTDTTGKYVTLQTTNDGVQKVRAGAFAGGGGSTDGWLRAVVTTDFGLSDVNTAQTAFPSAIDQVTLESNSTYYFEFAFDMSVGNSSHATGMGFDLGSTTLNRFNMQVMGYPAVANNVTSLQTTSWWTSVTPNSAMMAASAVTGNHLRGWGYMSVDTGGDVTPQVIFSAAPGGTNLMKAGSYIHFRKVGDGSFTTNAGFK